MRYKRITFGTRSFKTLSKSKKSKLEHDNALPTLQYSDVNGERSTKGVFTPHPKHFAEYTYNKELDIWVERQDDPNRVFHEILIPETSRFFNYDFFDPRRGAITNIIANSATPYLASTLKIDYPHLVNTLSDIRYKFLDLLRKL